ncbi:MAG: ABC transporter ATP-binding protein/permease [Lachnospiraceae bacterium]|nr:ABC transporter ATP-binding protein/permease [Lachnospiraceae bacterium]
MSFEDQKIILKKVWNYILPYRSSVIAVLVLSVLIVAGSLYVPVLVGKVIDILLPGYIEMAVIKKHLIKILVIVLVTAFLQWLMNAMNNDVTYHIVRDIRRDAFNRLQSVPIAYLDENPAGDLVSRIMTDADQLADGLLLGFTQFFTGVMTIVATLVIMIRLSFPIALVVVVITPLSLYVASYIATHTYALFSQQAKMRGAQTALINETLENEKIVKAFGQEKQIEKRFETMNRELEKISLKALFYSSLTNPCTRFVNSLVYAAVALFGGYAVVNGKMSVGLLAVFLSYSTQYTKPFNEISGVVTELQNAIACAGRIFEVIEKEPEQTDPMQTQTPAALGVQGRVSCRDVNFSYVKDKKLIEHFNVEVMPGQNVAIVGPTGCGKTTVINLLMRFYDVDSGTILVDEKDIRQMPRSGLRRSYGMVLQDTWLRSGTIRDNICFGKPDATPEEVVAAAKAAYADSFIRRLPKGYDTVIGEDGGLLSAGQKQLLCIARVMLSLPPMLILDEATSSIDTRTEMKIQSAFTAMMVGRTTFIVAHRLSTIRNADLILVMKDGNIIEQGNHESLLAAGGFYASLYNAV